jgi:hypothetical protein
MANCPNCGSTHIQLKRETNVSWGRTAAGWALFGVVGAAVGAVTGEDRTVNACLDCGTSWKATDLYNTLQRIESLTGAVLDLSIKQHRAYLNDFIADVISYYEEIAIADKKAERLLKESESYLSPTNDLGGCGTAFLGALIGFVLFVLSFVNGFADQGFFLLLLLPAVGYIAGVISEKRNKPKFEQQANRIKQRANEKKQQATEIKIAAREKYERALEDFIKNNPLV